MNDKESINGLPEDWKIVDVNSIGRIETGSTPSKQNANYYANDYPFYKPTDLEAGYNVRIARDNLSEAGVKQARFLPENSILVTCIGATIGKTGLIRKAGASNQQINAIIPSNNVDPGFVYYQVIGPEFQKKIKDNASATTLPILNKTKFQALPFVIAPLTEQQQIVSKIEELFSELDKGIEELKSAQQQLKVYRQSVLKWAFEGKLTNEDVKDGELPGGWKWVRFGNCHEIKSNLVSPAEFQDAPHIAPDNISKGTAQLFEYRTIKEDKVFSPKHRFFKGQILYSKIRPNLAKVIIAPFDGLCSADMYPIESSNDNLYTLYYMLTKSFVDRASNTESRTILPKINQKGLNEIMFPLCPLTEQQQIVQEIESRLSVCEKIEETIIDSLKQAEALRQSILKKAFEGKLLI
jgi:type I restriction enzyme, S subunit